MTVKIQLAQHALELGAVFKRKESQVEKEILSLELEMQQKKAAADAARMAFERSLNFTAALGADFACPDCWVRHGKQVAITPIPNETADDLFRCKDCGTELSIHV
jgi:hypothetical protein